MPFKAIAGETNRIIRVFIQDDSSLSGLTGLVYNSSGLALNYTKEGDSSETTINLVTATEGTYTSSGFVELNSSTLPGVYEIGLPSAVLSTAGTVDLMLQGATDMAPCPIKIEVRGIEELYPDGCIWASEDVSNTGTTVGVDGTIGNPVEDIATAMTLVASTGIRKIKVTSGENSESYISGPSADLEDVDIEGVGNAWILLASSYEVNRVRFSNLKISGYPDDMSNVLFEDCQIDSCYLGSSTLRRCEITASLDLIKGSQIVARDCFSDYSRRTLDFDTPSIPGTGGSTVRLYNYAGNLEIRGMDTVGSDDTLQITGTAELTINSDCLGGTIEYSPGVSIGNNQGSATLTPYSPLSFEGSVANANLTQIMGSSLTQDQGGRLAENFSVLFTNGSALATATLDHLSNVKDRIGAFTGSGINTVLGFFQALLRKDVSIPSDIGGTFDPSTDSLEAIQEAGGITDWTVNEREQIRYRLKMDGDTDAPTDTDLPEVNVVQIEATDATDQLATLIDAPGGGANTVNLSVENDSAAAVEGATLRIIKSGETDIVRTTDVNGEAIAYLDNGTYSVNVTAPGHDGDSFSLVVSGATTPSAYVIDLTITPTQTGPTISTGYAFVHDEDGDGEDGVVCTCRLTDGSGDAGYGRDMAEKTGTSSGGGNISIDGFLRGCVYMCKLGDGDEERIEVPDAPTFQLPEMLRTDS